MFSKQSSMKFIFPITVVLPKYCPVLIEKKQKAKSFLWKQILFNYSPNKLGDKYFLEMKMFFRVASVSLKDLTFFDLYRVGRVEGLEGQTTG